MRRQHSKPKFYETEQKESKKSQRLLQDCQNVIKQLQTQLQYALQQNQEKDKIIKILTEQKEFYEQESKKSDEKMYPKLKEQISFNQSLINGLKQHNKELTQKNILLEQQNQDLWIKCKQKDQLLQITESNITKLQQEKLRLEKEWGEILKNVKRKIFEIQSQNNSYDRVILKDNVKKRAVSRGANRKQTINGQNRKNQIKTVTNNKTDATTKVQALLKEIDQKLLSYDFIDMIQSKDARRQIKVYDSLDQNKENISENINTKQTQRFDAKTKKVPILKLSELTLKEVI